MRPRFTVRGARSSLPAFGYHAFQFVHLRPVFLCGRGRSFVAAAADCAKADLLVASYLFYAAWEPWFVTLLLYSTAVNWVAGELLDAFDDRPRRRRAVLWSSVILNVGMLAAFKYGNEFLSLSRLTATKLGLPYVPSPMTILLPIGLSFFTFQSLSYTIDVYRRDIKPAKSPLDFAPFVSFFPAAGPLLRAGQFLPQCAETRRERARNLPGGCPFALLACS